MSRQVTAVYAEESTVARFSTGARDNVLDLKHQACSELANAAQRYGFMNGFPCGDIGSIVLSSGSHGQLDFGHSTVVSSLCGADDFILATVPAPSTNGNTNIMSRTLTNPIQDHLSSMFQQHVEAINVKFMERLQEVVLSERAEREEALKAEREEREEALKVEREKREEALKVEREKREEALKVEREKRDELKAALKVEREKREELKAALKAEGEKREEALKMERENWEKALKVERDEREMEKADARKKYESLKDHLFEVEETTLDTVGWITTNDTKMLDRIKLRHLLNQAQEMLAIAVGLTNNPFGASLAWREALGSAEDLPTRLAEARALFDRPEISLDQPTLVFVSSPEGLSLVVEAKSSIRLRGDRIAHPVTVARTHFDGPLSRNPFPSEIPGLRALVDFVCAQK